MLYQLLHAIPNSWKQAVLNDNGNYQNIIYLDSDLIRDNVTLKIDYLIQNNSTIYQYF